MEVTQTSWILDSFHFLLLEPFRVGCIDLEIDMFWSIVVLWSLVVASVVGKIKDETDCIL